MRILLKMDSCEGWLYLLLIGVFLLSASCSGNDTEEKDVCRRLSAFNNYDESNKELELKNCSYIENYIKSYENKDLRCDFDKTVHSVLAEGKIFELLSIICSNSVEHYKDFEKHVPENKKIEFRKIAAFLSAEHFAWNIFRYLAKTLPVDARINITNRSMTLLHYSVLSNDMNLVKYFLSQGWFIENVGINLEKIPKSNQNVYPIEVGIMGRDRTPILAQNEKAYKYPSIEIVELLIRYGADLKKSYYSESYIPVPPEMDGFIDYGTPLEMISKTNRPKKEKEKLRKLIKNAMEKQGIKVNDLEEKKETNDSLYYYCPKIFHVLAKNLPVDTILPRRIKDLESNYSPIVELAEAETTLLDWAVALNDIKIVKYLLENEFIERIGINKEKIKDYTKNESQIYPIEIAIMGKDRFQFFSEERKNEPYPRVEITKLLVENGADLTKVYKSKEMFPGNRIVTYGTPLEMVEKSRRAEHEKEELRIIIKDALKKQKVERTEVSK
jgi:ankyrin repeat protein